MTIDKKDINFMELNSNYTDVILRLNRYLENVKGTNSIPINTVKIGIKEIDVSINNLTKYLDNLELEIKKNTDNTKYVGELLLMKKRLEILFTRFNVVKKQYKNILDKNSILNGKEIENNITELNKYKILSFDEIDQITSDLELLKEEIQKYKAYQNNKNIILDLDEQEEKEIEKDKYFIQKEMTFLTKVNNRFKNIDNLSHYISNGIKAYNINIKNFDNKLKLSEKYELLLDVDNTKFAKDVQTILVYLNNEKIDLDKIIVFYNFIITKLDIISKYNNNTFIVGLQDKINILLKNREVNLLEEIINDIEKHFGQDILDNIDNLYKLYLKIDNINAINKALFLKSTLYLEFISKINNKLDKNEEINLNIINFIKYIDIYLSIIISLNKNKDINEEINNSSYKDIYIKNIITKVNFETILNKLLDKSLIITEIEQLLKEEIKLYNDKYTLYTKIKLKIKNLNEVKDRINNIEKYIDNKLIKLLNINEQIKKDITRQRESLFTTYITKLYELKTDTLINNTNINNANLNIENINNIINDLDKKIFLFNRDIESINSIIKNISNYSYSYYHSKDSQRNNIINDNLEFISSVNIISELSNKFNRKYNNQKASYDRLEKIRRLSYSSNTSSSWSSGSSSSSWGSSSSSGSSSGSFGGSDSF